MSWRTPVNARDGVPSLRHQLAPGRQRLVVLVAAFLGVALLAAACGGSAPSGVASVGSTTTSASAPSSAAGNSGSPPSAATTKAMLVYAKCMRTHGELNFPDPKPGGGFDLSAYPAINPVGVNLSETDFSLI
jgi:hypothetical protein